MHIKKFEAQNMREALMAIKKEFGSDAVILSVRKKENEKGLFGLQKYPGVEVTAASDSKQYDGESLSFKKHPYNESSYGVDRMQSSPLVNKKGFLGFFNKPDPAQRYFEEDVVWKKSTENHKSKELFSIYHQMLDQQVEKDIALELIREMNGQTLPNISMHNEHINNVLSQVFEQKGIRANRVKILKQIPNIIALIGPTGVGKTTTIAKLSAAAKNGTKKKRVGLITLDDKRIGAIEQLKVFSKILGVEFRAASDKKNFKTYIEEFQSVDLVLVDTPGVSPSDSTQLNFLKDIFSKTPDIEFHLVLSASTNDRTMKDVIDKFRQFDVKGLIFTKLDECITFGGILNQLYYSKLPASYFSFGQKIPEDIEAASIKRLLDHLFRTIDKNRFLSGSPEMLAQKIIMFEKMLEGFEVGMPVGGTHDFEVHAGYDSVLTATATKRQIG
jgi:flagellar biosynthesis protein FlhF